MKNLLEHKLALFLIAATVIAAVIIGIFSALAEGEKATLAESAVSGTAEAGHSAASGVGGWLSNLFGYFGNVKELRAENEALRHENIELDRQLRDTRGMEAENEQLREMLDLVKTESKLELEAAKVIAKDPSNWYSSFTINKGTNSGIKKGQPVITANEELIGQVYKVGSDWAEVITVLDPESGVGGMVERSKSTGVLEGDFSLRYSGQCRLGYLPRDTDIERGDYVETSGMGGVYPKGLLIGRVLEVKEDNTNMSKYAIVEPSAEIGKLMQVFVLKNSVEVIKRRTTDDGLLNDNNDNKDGGKSGSSDRNDSDDDDDDSSSAGSRTTGSNGNRTSSGSDSQSGNSGGGTRQSGSSSGTSSGSSSGTSSGASGTRTTDTSPSSQTTQSGGSNRTGSTDGDGAGSAGMNAVTGSELRE